MSEVSFIPMEAIGERGSLDVSNIRFIDDVKNGYSLFFDGDVLIAKITPCFENGKGALAQGLLNGVGYGTTELHVLRAGPKLNQKFLYYVTAGDTFRKLGEAEMTGAAGQKRVPEDFILDYRIAIPPLEHQQVIVNFLDRETTNIDALVAVKQRQLELLGEKQQALVMYAVTRGLDSGVLFRNSDIPWLKELPAHWGLQRAKWLFTERDERSTTGEETLLSLRMEVGLVPHNEVSEKTTRPEDLIGYKKVSVDEIVLNRMRAASGLVAVAPREGLVSPDYAVLKTKPETNPNYFTYLFKTEPMQDVFRSESTGLGTGSSGFLRLYTENFMDLCLPVPPFAEQEQIVNYISEESARLDSLRQAGEMTIKLLLERRAALIAAAVTGTLQPM